MCVCVCASSCHFIWRSFIVLNRSLRVLETWIRYALYRIEGARGKKGKNQMHGSDHGYFLGEAHAEKRKDLVGWNNNEIMTYKWIRSSAKRVGSRGEGGQVLVRLVDDNVHGPFR